MVEASTSSANNKLTHITWRCLPDDNNNVQRLNFLRLVCVVDSIANENEWAEPRSILPISASKLKQFSKAFDLTSQKCDFKRARKCNCWAEKVYRDVSIRRISQPIRTSTYRVAFCEANVLQLTPRKSISSAQNRISCNLFETRLHRQLHSDILVDRQ